MVAETILKNLGITYPGTYTDNGEYVVELDNDAQFGRVYAVFDHSDDFELISDGGFLSSDTVEVEYENEDEGVVAKIEADFENDVYTLTLYEE